MITSPPNHKTEKPRKSLLQKRTATVSRWLHIYLSMVSFVIVLFFAVTGLTLNHPDWFDGKETINHFTGQVPSKWVMGKDTVAIAKFEIVQFLKQAHHIKGEVNEFIIDDSQCAFSFIGPGYIADAVVNRDNGTYNVNEASLGLVAVMNDLHKGRDTGKRWSLLIDIAAIFMSLLSLTGIIMICFMKKKRFSGFVLAIGGGLICYLVYYFLVP